MQADPIEEANGAMRRLLSDHFCKKQKTNPAYSLRALAAKLKVDQSLLSKVLNGERRFSLRAIEGIAEKLGLSPLEIKELTHGMKRSKYLQIEEDRFRLIAEWHHFAILELAKTKSFSPQPETIGDRLGIHVEQARVALDRLQRLGLLDLERGDPRTSVPSITWANGESTNMARKQIQRTFAEKSLQSIDEVEFELRDHGSLTVAINKKRLAEFKKRLTEIRRELGSYFQLDRDLDEVYQLTISLFPLTIVKKTEEQGK